MTPFLVVKCFAFAFVLVKKKELKVGLCCIHSFIIRVWGRKWNGDGDKVIMENKKMWGPLSAHIDIIYGVYYYSTLLYSQKVTWFAYSILSRMTARINAAYCIFVNLKH